MYLLLGDELQEGRDFVLFTAVVPHSEYLLNKYELNDWLPGTGILGLQASHQSTGPQIGRATDRVPSLLLTTDPSVSHLLGCALHTLGSILRFGQN